MTVAEREKYEHGYYTDMTKVLKRYIRKKRMKKYIKLCLAFSLLALVFYITTCEPEGLAML